MDLNNQIYNKIAELLEHVCNNPLLFVSETDIHVLLMNKLFEIGTLNPWEEKNLYSTDVKKGMFRGHLSTGVYKTMLVHKEYGHNTGKGERSDIVIFNEKEVKDINDPINLKKADSQYLHPDYIFEMGTEKSGGQKDVYKEHFGHDVGKLKRAQRIGFLINIHRNYINVPRGSGRFLKNKQKLNEYKVITMKLWEEYKKFKNLRFLIFFIDIGTTKFERRSKINLFYPSLANFKAVNLKNIKENVLQICREEV